jgi:hypothetical protein
MVKSGDSSVDSGSRSPITLRLGDLEAEVERRRRGGESAASVLKRDLARFYAGSRATLERLDFLAYEADVLTETLRFSKLDPSSAHFLWAEVDEKARRLYANNPDRLAMALSVVEQIRNISSLDALAILDAVAVFREHFANNGHDAWGALEASGLSTEGPPRSEDETPGSDSAE